MHRPKLSQKFSPDSVFFLLELVNNRNWKDYFLSFILGYKLRNSLQFDHKIKYRRDIRDSSKFITIFKQDSSITNKSLPFEQYLQGMKAIDE